MENIVHVMKDGMFNYKIHEFKTQLGWKGGAMALEGVTKRTEHHGYSIGIYLREQRMVTRT